MSFMLMMFGGGLDSASGSCQEVEARITANTVEIFHRAKLVATHLRNLRPDRASTVAEHMPSWGHHTICTKLHSKPNLGRQAAFRNERFRNATN
jgi:hypothetical protein